MTTPGQSPTGPTDPQQPFGTPPQQPGAPSPAPGAPQPPAYGSQPPAYGSQPPAYTAPAGGAATYGGATDPGKTMGIVGLVLSFLGCLSIVGLILSIIARNKSKKAGYNNGLALAGIIVGSIVLVISIIGAVVVGLAGMKFAEKCEDLGPGVHYENGVEYNCP